LSLQMRFQSYEKRAMLLTISHSPAERSMFEQQQLKFRASLKLYYKCN